MPQEEKSATGGSASGGKHSEEIINDAGAEARASDIIDALIEVKAWQDGERKAEAEAQQQAANN